MKTPLRHCIYLEPSFSVTADIEAQNQVNRFKTADWDRFRHGGNSRSSISLLPILRNFGEFDRRPWHEAVTHAPGRV